MKNILWRIFLLVLTQAALGEQGGKPPPPPKLRRGHEWFEDLWRSGRLEAGTVLHNRGIGYILILDNAEVAALQNNICPFQPTIRMYRFPLNADTPKRFQVRRVKENVSQELRLMRIAIARRLSNNDLPYHPLFCNLSHWWAFILCGKRHRMWFKVNCPLARSWANFNHEDVTSGKFTFLDECGTEYHDFPPYDSETDDRTNFSCFASHFRNKPLPNTSVAEPLKTEVTGSQ